MGSKRKKPSDPAALSSNGISALRNAATAESEVKALSRLSATYCDHAQTEPYSASPYPSAPRSSATSESESKTQSGVTDANPTRESSAIELELLEERIFGRTNERIYSVEKSINEAQNGLKYNVNDQLAKCKSTCEKTISDFKTDTFKWFMGTLFLSILGLVYFLLNLQANMESRVTNTLKTDVSNTVIEKTKESIKTVVAVEVKTQIDNTQVLQRQRDSLLMDIKGQLGTMSTTSNATSSTAATDSYRPGIASN